MSKSKHEEADERLAENAKLGRAIMTTDALAERTKELAVRCIGQHPSIVQELGVIAACLVAIADELRDLS